MLFLSWTQSLSFSTVHIMHVHICSSDASSAHSSSRGPNGPNPHYHVFLNFLCSVAQLCPTLCNPMDCSTPGFPVLCCLLELAQTHVHRVGDIIQPSRPLSSPSPPVFNFSQHRCSVTQSCSTLCNPVDCSKLGSSVHGILQARILELVTMPFSRGSSQPRD